MSNNNFLTEASMILDYGYGATPKMNENAYDDRIAQDANEDDQFMNQIEEEPETTVESDEGQAFMDKLNALAEEAETLIYAKPEIVRAMGANAKHVFTIAFLGSDNDRIEDAYSEFMSKTEAPVDESTNSLDYLASRMLRDPGMLQDEE